MKKIFILTGEASGDKLASKAISDLKKINPNIEYLSVGGENLKRIGINSIYDLKEITYLGFTSVFLNIFKNKKKINETVKVIEEFNPEILFTVDSPDFTLRVAERVKKIVVEHLGVEKDKVVEPASFVDDLGADSLDTVELVMAFEEEFNIEIPDDVAEKITTIKEAIEHIENSQN